jgi:hypothetical protein
MNIIYSSPLFFLYDPSPPKQKPRGKGFQTSLPSWLALIISFLGLIVKIVKNCLDIKNKIGYERQIVIKPRRFEVRRPLLSSGFFIWIESQDHEGFCLAEA